MSYYAGGRKAQSGREKEARVPVSECRPTDSTTDPATTVEIPTAVVFRVLRRIRRRAAIRFTNYSVFRKGG